MATGLSLPSVSHRSHLSLTAVVLGKEVPLCGGETGLMVERCGEDLCLPSEKLSGRGRMLLIPY